MGPAARSEARTHPITDTVLPTTQSTSPTTAHFQRYSPFTQCVCSLAAMTPHSPLSPAPLRGIAPLAVRHADSQLLMLHNPHYQRRSNLLRNRSAWPGMKTMSHPVSTPGAAGVEGTGGSGGHGRASRSTTPSLEARVWRSRGQPDPTTPGTPTGPQATREPSPGIGQA